MKKSKEWLAHWNGQLALYTRTEKIWFWVVFSIFVIYVEVVIFAQNTALGFSSVPGYNCLSALVALPLCIWGGVLPCSRLRGLSKNADHRKMARPKALLFAGAVFLLTFLCFFAWQRAYWPGSFSIDSISQYGQAEYGVYNNWHPALHTWLFFTLPLKLFPHRPAAIVSMQIVWFSAAVAYLFLTLYQNGASKCFLVLSYLYILANPNTAQIMLLPWKDSAMSIFALLVFTQLIQIYASNGAWLKKWYNVASFSAFAFLGMGVRHNAILWVAPVFIILFVFFKANRKSVAISAAAVVLGMVLLQGPIFAALQVKPAGGRTVETMGLPMTILSNVYTQDPDALSAEAQNFMSSLASEDEWKIYQTGDFNSIKFRVDTGSGIEEAGPQKILRYTLEAVLKSPGYSWQAFTALTRVVWGFDGGGWTIGVGIKDNDYGIRYHDTDEMLFEIVTAYARQAESYATQYLFHYIGTVILFLLAVAVANVGNGNLGAAMMVLAPMAYNFGTMLLLSGHDFRFFHFNFVVAVPLLFLICMTKKSPQNGSD